MLNPTNLYPIIVVYPSMKLFKSLDGDDFDAETVWDTRPAVTILHRGNEQLRITFSPDGHAICRVDQEESAESILKTQARRREEVLFELSVPEAVRQSTFGCRNCLWYGSECATGNRYVPARSMVDDLPSCANYAYYD